MVVLISYDISSDKRRRKVVKVLEGYGYRVQYSVFECSVSSAQLKQLTRALRPYVDGKAGESVRIYPLDADAVERVVVLGRDLRRVLPPLVVV